MISVAIRVTGFVGFKEFSSFPDDRVYSGEPAPSSIQLFFCSRIGDTLMTML